ncbi:MAG TPA: hypothetical protein P5531_00310 [Bacteroidales bacterium]|nr:hypothetical protein [Bacteroidales bacterium]HSA42104.1 hypothetical protein [Bacteroidales bacterium]
MILLIGLFSNSVAAQDFIILKNGDEIKAVVKEIGLTEIRYKKFSNPDGPVVVIPKSEVFMIKYKDGSKEVFKQADPPATAAQAPAPAPVPAIQPVNPEPAAGPGSGGKTPSKGRLQFRAQGLAGGTLGDMKKWWGSSNLVDWNQFTYGPDFQIMVRLSRSFLLGPEFSIHRLYYWKTERYNGYYHTYDWGNKWRYHLGVMLEFSDDKFYTQTGVNMDIDNEVVCLSLAPGLKIRLGNHVSIPFGLRADWMVEENGLSTYGATIGILIH